MSKIIYSMTPLAIKKCQVIFQYKTFKFSAPRQLGPLTNTRGQLIIEYVLLLAITAIIAAIVVSRLGSRNSDEPGAIIQGWNRVITSIGEDKADSCFKPNCP